MGLVRVRGRLTGPTGRSEDAELLVDTGATLLVVSRSLAGKLDPVGKHAGVHLRRRHSITFRHLGRGSRVPDDSDLRALFQPWQRLLGRPASEYGRVCHGGRGHEGGGRSRRVFMLPTLRVS